MSGPLAGVQILDMTAMLSGPFATQALGDMGADVIKVETPDGDSIRGMGPMRSSGMGAMFLHANRSKRSIVLDLKQESAKQALLRLIKKCDVFICNTRLKALQRLGLDYQTLKQLHPSLIYVNIVGYGSTGTYADKPAYDDLIQGAVGIPSLGAAAHGSARYAPLAIADRITGMNATSVVLAALYHRLNTGEGQHVEVPMFETMAALVLADHMGGETFEPALGPPVYERYAAIRRPFPTLDGSLCLMVHTDKQWQSFFSIAGRNDVLLDPRFADIGSRTRNVGALYEIVAGILATRSTTEWVEALEGVDIPVARLESVESLLSDPHLAAVGFLETTEHPTEGPIRAMATTSTWSATQPHPTRHTPRLGEHSEEVLREAGFSDYEIKQMMAEGSTRGTL
jgi:crotonobetainyl-CoA:carnitine CoA-transferase CaiB-like acyl-CoA transferase